MLYQSNLLKLVRLVDFAKKLVLTRERDESLILALQFICLTFVSLNRDKSALQGPLEGHTCDLIKS